jgi:hypothetical protein
MVLLCSVTAVAPGDATELAGLLEFGCAGGLSHPKNIL